MRVVDPATRVQCCFSFCVYTNTLSTAVTLSLSTASALHRARSYPPTPLSRSYPPPCESRERGSGGTPNSRTMVVQAHTYSICMHITTYMHTHVDVHRAIYTRPVITRASMIRYTYTDTGTNYTHGSTHDNGDTLTTVTFTSARGPLHQEASVSPKRACARGRPLVPKPNRERALHATHSRASCGRSP